MYHRGASQRVPSAPNVDRAGDVDETGESAPAPGAKIAVALAGTAALLVLLAATASADCGNTSAAVVQGQWQYISSISYTNSPSQDFGLAAGVHPARLLAFSTTCLGPLNCSLIVGSAASPAQPLEGVDQSLYSDGSTTLNQSGATTARVIPSGGVGGQNLPQCRPPSLAFHLSVHVAAAIKDSSGAWRASYVTGSEVSTAWWTCNGGTGVASSQEHDDFVAVPAGTAFPASVAALCAPPATPHPVVAATGPSSGTTPPQNPQQSTISTALTPPASAFQSLGHAVGNALITLGIVLFITFPATLFNKTLEENYDDIRDIVKRRFGWLARLSGRIAAGASTRRDALVFGVVVMIGSALGGLNDPHFGFNRASLLTYSAVILAVLFGVGVSTLVGFIYRRARSLTTTARLTALPAGLVVAAACVFVSRITQFQPGYLYGIICGVAFAATLPRDANGHVIAISSAVTLVLGVVAWLLWVPVKQTAEVPGASPLAVIAGNFLAAVFVGGLVGSVLSLVPLRFLPGGALAEWNRVVWGTFFGLAVFGLLQVMLRPESSSVHTGTTAVVTAGVLFVIFGGISVTTRIYFGRRRRRREQVSAPA